jgi:hypothetical protein
MDKQSRRIRIGRLQKVRAEPVTDPAEQAELDAQRHRLPNGFRTPEVVPSSELATPSVLADLCRRLPPGDWPPLLMRMASGLPPEEQMELLEQLAAQLPADVARRLEEELQGRLAEK